MLLIIKIYSTQKPIELPSLKSLFLLVLGMDQVSLVLLFGLYFFVVWSLEKLKPSPKMRNNFWIEKIH